MTMPCTPPALAVVLWLAVIAESVALLAIGLALAVRGHDASKGE